MSTVPAPIPQVRPSRRPARSTSTGPDGTGKAAPLVGMDRLVDAVQTNCHIADATQATDLSLCIYLLQMREFYRWEQGAEPQASLPREELGAWLADREALWASLEGREFGPIPVLGDSLDPFDTAGINARLRPHGLVYGAGLLAPGRVSFFLGDLETRAPHDEVEVLVSGCEHARGLSAPPAALAGATVLLRRESLQRWLWEKYEAWSLKSQEGAFKATLDAYGLARVGPVAAVNDMAREQAETLILHELGEFEAGQLLGPGWHDLRGTLASRRADLHLRAVRDHLADCLVTLPTLLKQDAAASMHFWFSNFEGVRAVLFPRLAQAYTAWCAGDGGAALREATAAGALHWLHQCRQLCSLHRPHGDAASAAVQALLYAPEMQLT